MIDGSKKKKAAMLKKRFALFILFVLAITLLNPIEASSKTEPEIRSEALKYVVYIRKENKLPDLERVEPVSFWGNIWSKIWKTDLAGMATAIIHKDGNDYYVVTNSHVIKNGKKGERYHIWFHDSEAPIVAIKHGWDDLFDWGILTFEDKSYAPSGFAEFGDSSEVKTGTGKRFCWLGNPLDLRNYWACGEIMKERAYTPRAKTMKIAVQVNCNPGNSGSPLIDENGKVMGLVESISTSASPLCFVSPINVLKKIFPLLKDGGEIKHGKLNIAVLNTSDFTQSELDVIGLAGTEKGVIVASVMPGSAAEAAGIKARSRLVDLKNESGSLNLKIQSTAEFIENLHLNFLPGDHVILTLKEEDAYKDIKIAMEPANAAEEVQMVIIPRRNND